MCARIQCGRGNVWSCRLWSLLCSFLFSVTVFDTLAFWIGFTEYPNPFTWCAFDDSLNYLDIFSHFEQFDGNKLQYLKVFDVYQLSLVHGRFEWFRPNNNRSSDLNCMLNKIIHFIQKQKKIFRKWWNPNQNKWLYIQIVNDLFSAFGFSICGSWNKITTTWYVCK